MPHSTPLRKTRTIRVLDTENDAPEEEFHISDLDCIMPKIYIPLGCTYKVDKGEDTEVIISNLCAGLERLLREYRFFAGSLHENDKGRSYIKLSREQAEFTVHINDLRHTEFPSYNDLADQHFPASQLDTDTLFPPTFTPTPVFGADAGGASVAAALVQLNLIEGGLIIALAVHHLCADARGLDAVLARWAAHTRSIRDSNVPPPEPFNPECLNRMPLNSSKPDGDPCKPAVASLRYSPHAPETATGRSGNLQSHIWHIPRSKLAALKDRVSHALSKMDEQEETSLTDWVSTNDCVTALMWRCIVRSRLAFHGIHDTAADTRTVALLNCLDMRASKPLPSGYPGNVVMFARSERTLSSLVAPGPEAMARAACAVRTAVSQYRTKAMMERSIDWIAACPRKADVEMAFDVLFQLDVVVTSWRVLRAYEVGNFGFGPLMSLRWIQPVFDGYCFLYPTNGGDGVEIHLTLEEGCMERLLMDQELNEFATTRSMKT